MSTISAEDLAALSPEEREAWELCIRAVSWVGQEDTNGCVVAALAMIVGKSYAQVKAELPPKDLSQSAFTAFTAESYLYEHGYTLQKKWKHICSANKDRDGWPTAPFAPVHYVQVAGAPTGNAHAVVMLENGDVLDPWAGSKPKKLADYYAVNEIIGVWPEAARNLLPALLLKVARITQRLTQANKLQEMTLQNEIRWMQRAETAESRVSDLTKEKDSALQERDRWKSPIIRCHCCGGTQIWKCNEAGEIEVYHDCANGLHAMKEERDRLRDEVQNVVLTNKEMLRMKQAVESERDRYKERAGVLQAQLQSIYDKAVEVGLITALTPDSTRKENVSR